MKQSKIFILLLCFITVLFASCATLPGGNRSQKFSYKYQIVSVDEKLDYLETKIKYPQFDNIPELNKKIENTILSNWKSFKSYSKDEWNEMVSLNNRGGAKLHPFEYLVNCEVSGNKQYISVLINTYIFNGGAHGNTTLTSINYEYDTKRIIDVQKASGMTIDEVSRVCRSQLYKRLIDDNKNKLPPAEEDSMREMINTGAFPQAGNFQIFTVDGSKVIVWFEPYSVAPYSYGIQKVQIK